MQSLEIHHQQMKLLCSSKLQVVIKLKNKRAKMTKPEFTLVKICTI